MRRLFLVSMLCFCAGAAFQRHAIPRLVLEEPVATGYVTVLNLSAQDLATEACPVPDRIRFSIGPVEWICIGPDAFYVRGEKVEQDATEARTVYDAFVQFVIFSGANPNARK